MGSSKSKATPSENKLDQCSTIMNGFQYDAKKLPSTKFKIVSFVRHAQGFHNEAAERDGDIAYESELYVDAKLTEKGFSQCNELAEKVGDDLQRTQLVVVSPMNRTLATAQHCFPTLLKNKVPFVALESLREQVVYLKYLNGILFILVVIVNSYCCILKISNVYLFYS